ncbi:MAG: holo-ACP synthase [Acidaminococcaceae bacterium]|nr:holo-ACP synthase [Acidaminococcaceae bacterium]MDD4721382.1 holo-ACP synthase [Acidaminococcaceae bacterium]
MIIGIGCDLIEISRIEKALANPKFAEKVFTAEEIKYCIARGKQKNQSYAARYAAKEAVAKALGTGFRGGSLQDVEVVKDSMGKPEVKLSGIFATLAKERGCTNIHLSLSHVKELAMAQVVVEG